MIKWEKFDIHQSFFTCAICGGRILQGQTGSQLYKFHKDCLDVLLLVGKSDEDLITIDVTHYPEVAEYITKQRDLRLSLTGEKPLKPNVFKRIWGFNVKIYKRIYDFIHEEEKEYFLLGLSLGYINRFGLYISVGMIVAMIWIWLLFFLGGN